jgi:hypothetical protein
MMTGTMGHRAGYGRMSLPFFPRLGDVSEFTSNLFEQCFYHAMPSTDVDLMLN